ncbi:DUF1761 domain-containing protein [Candidatus Saccharibacteria bacterium]|nr:DUF1761 domain-containing protein [Candidatus Saccharibacteria bacterium]MCB9821676.1 DUF1761 domain-containing protein [Candidatus Nomurabacteria bacterium]
MLGIDVGAVLLATGLMYVIGAIWYMVLFAKQWGEMFGFDKLSKAKQKEMQKQMMPMMLLQLIVTALSAFALAKLIALAPDYSVYKLAVCVWLGFSLPTIVSSVIFGGVEAKWIQRRITIMSTESLAHILAAAWLIGLLQ